ncbi:sensor domain-containing diguanylate cyclase [Hahella sp. CCB-MM4]|uniref:sensor domain-containing diguanylate cyclase n=1 Tax=Hahella sp. (strain CCB-MM4) TaxID=1926491 RepID=UPI000B9C6E83|nr:diguanylate cyclase [Hahella sp. CCB-MM4]OZG74606.1 sensor domain-containing diguanylate cyclase [Hahella sp. CCB-MM4]
MIDVVIFKSRCSPPKLGARQPFLKGLFLILLFLGCLSAGAADPQKPSHEVARPVLLTSELTSLALGPHLDLLEDKTGELTFAEVRDPANKDRFLPIGDESPNFGFTTSTWWARMSLINPYPDAVDVVLRQDYPLIDYLDFWSQDKNGNWTKIATGDRTNFDTRPVNHRVFLFPVRVPPNKIQTFYFRYKTQGAMNIGLFVHSPLDLMNLISEEYLALGIYYGGFIVLTIYNLIMFITVRERTFAHYLLYVVSYGLYMSVHNGLSFQYLWPDNTWMANHSLLILLALSLTGGLQFTRSILISRVASPRLDRISYYLQILCMVCMALSPLVSYHTMIIPLAVLTLVIAVHIFAMAVIALMKGSGASRYYMVAFSSLLIGVVIYMLKTFGILPHNAFTQNAFQIGSLIEMVLLSLAVASRLNEFKRKTYKDALTQLYNRRYFDDQINIEFDRARQHEQPLSMVVIDIDNFKHFNDTFGHAQGDSALKTVAGILNATVRKPNIPCRYGGEEFVLILPQTNHHDVSVLAERIRRRVEKGTKGTLNLTVSLGHATLSRDNFISANDLFVAADFALYTAKENGRNRVIDFDMCESKRTGEHLPPEAVEEVQATP